MSKQQPDLRTTTEAEADWQAERSRIPWSDRYLHQLVTEARVCREDAEANASRAEAAEQELARLRRELRTATEHRNRLQVSERQARELVTELRLRDRDDTVYVDSDLLESDRGIFVPIPAGHVLSVTVTPYDAAPVEAEVVSE